MPRDANANALRPEPSGRHETGGGHETGETGGESARPTRRVLLGGVLFLLVLLGLAGFKSYRDLDAVRARQSELLLELDRTEEEIVGLEARIDRLQNDPLTLERLAREELQMVRPGEVVIVLPEERPIPRAVPAPPGG